MSQRAPFLVVVGAVGCVVLALCLCIGAYAGFSYLSPLLSLTGVDRIAYVDNSNNIQVVDSNGEHRVALTTDATGTDRVYLFPTWSPDGKRFVYTEDGGNGTGSVWVADVTGKAQPKRVGDGTLAAWSWR